MKLSTTNRPTLQRIALALAIFLSLSSVASPAQTRKPSESDRDIEAIGHRNLFPENRGFSLTNEKARGEIYSAAFERGNEILEDPAINAYIGQVAQRLAQNSDAQIPITVRIVNSNEVSLFLPPGGYQYISIGLLLRLQNEGELASVLARGIAHTALHIADREIFRANLLQMASIPNISSIAFGSKETNGAWLASDGFVLLANIRGYESEADYFGIQYLYKSGYETDCFLSALQSVWGSTRTRQAFSPYPALPERLKALHKEINDILPKRTGEIVSTPEFPAFQNRLQSLQPPEPTPRLVRPDADPKLIHHDSLLSN